MSFQHLSHSSGLAHAEAELGVVFEERVGPGKALALGVGRVGEGRIGATPDGGAACQGKSEKNVT